MFRLFCRKMTYSEKWKIKPTIIPPVTEENIAKEISLTESSYGNCVKYITRKVIATTDKARYEIQILFTE